MLLLEPRPEEDIVSEEERVTERVRELVVESLQLQVEPEMIDVDEPLFGGDATVDPWDRWRSSPP